MSTAKASYGAILVYAGWSPAAQALVRCAADLARSFGARLIGVTTPALVQVRLAEPSSAASDGHTGLLELEVRANMEAVGARFREIADLPSQALRWTWRRMPPVEALEREAQGADLCVVAPTYVWPPAGPQLQKMRRTLRIGLPVLVVPFGLPKFRAGRIAVLWNETSACRRAMADAMPFLLRAQSVLVVNFCQRPDQSAVRARLREVCASLATRGVVAACEARPLDGRRIADLASTLATDRQVGLIVAGAYGNDGMSRAFTGSTTEQLIAAATTPLLMSH